MILYRLFPFIPLILSVVFNICYSIYGPSDAQDAIFYMYVLVLGLLGMLLFTFVGLVVLARQHKKLIYYKILFIILTIINLFTSILWALYGVWLVVVVLVIMVTGSIIIWKSNKKQ
jgi:hypothetical protein